MVNRFRKGIAVFVKVLLNKKTDVSILLKMHLFIYIAFVCQIVKVYHLANYSI